MARTSVQWFVTAVVVALALRALFRLFGAEGGSDGFVSWLYDTTDVLLQPVRGVFPSTATSSQYVLEFATLFAMVAYMVVGNVAEGVVERWSPKRK
jgi:uncharacterized protein YggT (Ycf19 family)